MSRMATFIYALVVSIGLVMVSLSLVSVQSPINLMQLGMILVVTTIIVYCAMSIHVRLMLGQWPHKRNDDCE